MFVKLAADHGQLTAEKDILFTDTFHHKINVYTVSKEIDADHGY